MGILWKPLPALFWSRRKSLYTFIYLWKSSGNLRKSLETFGDIRNSSEICRQSSEAVGKSSEIQVLWRRKIPCILLKKSWQVYNSIIKIEKYIKIYIRIWTKSIKDEVSIIFGIFGDSSSKFKFLRAGDVLSTSRPWEGGWQVFCLSVNFQLLTKIMISGTDSYMYLVHRGGPCFVLSQYGQLKLHLVRQSEWLFLFQQSLPPVRNQSKRKKKKKKESSTFSNNACKPKDKTRISSYDYRSWDKFDVVSMWVTCSMRFLCQLADVIPTCKILCM